MQCRIIISIIEPMQKIEDKHETYLVGGYFYGQMIDNYAKMQKID